jgi:hypothetical protein
MSAQKAELKGKKADFRLDILIKKNEDYYQAHCLQFDLVTTNDTLEGAQASIVDSCISHIIFSIDNNNIDYLYSPAPKEVWTEYYEMAKDEKCSVVIKELRIPRKAKVSPARYHDAEVQPFSMQEVVCHA